MTSEGVGSGKVSRRGCQDQGEAPWFERAGSEEPWQGIKAVKVGEEWKDVHRQRREPRALSKASTDLEQAMIAAGPEGSGNSLGPRRQSPETQKREFDRDIAALLEA